ncbi:MAG: hypothetical protein Q9196_002481 [Gyalolechia fulgens]
MAIVAVPETALLTEPVSRFAGGWSTAVRSLPARTMQPAAKSCGGDPQLDEGGNDAGGPGLVWRRGEKVLEVGFLGKKRAEESQKPDNEDDEIDEDA